MLGFARLARDTRRRVGRAAWRGGSPAAGSRRRPGAESCGSTSMRSSGPPDSSAQAVAAAGLATLAHVDRPRRHAGGAPPAHSSRPSSSWCRACRRWDASAVRPMSRAATPPTRTPSCRSRQLYVLDARAPARRELAQLLAQRGDLLAQRVHLFDAARDLVGTVGGAGGGSGLRRAATGCVTAPPASDGVLLHQMRVARFLLPGPALEPAAELALGEPLERVLDRRQVGERVQALGALLQLARASAGRAASARTAAPRSSGASPSASSTRWRYLCARGCRGSSRGAPGHAGRGAAPPRAPSPRRSRRPGRGSSTGCTPAAAS